MVLSSYLLTSVYKITNDQWLTIILCSGHWLFWGHEEGTEDAAWRTWPGRPLHDRQLRWKEAQDKGGFRGNAEKNPFLSFFSVSTSIVSKQMATPCRKDVRNCVIWTQISLMFIIPRLCTRPIPLSGTRSWTLGFRCPVCVNNSCSDWWTSKFFKTLF